MDKKENLLIALRGDMDQLDKMTKISKREFILRIFKYHILEFKKLKLEKKHVWYPIFEDVDTISGFNSKYKDLVKMQDAIKNVSLENLFKGVSKIEPAGEILNGFKFYYLCKFSNLVFFNLDFYMPKFIDLEFYEIYYWILHVHIKETNNNELFILIKELQSKNNDEDIKLILIEVLNKIYTRIKHGKKG
jgi:hypothetical protein